MSSDDQRRSRLSNAEVSCVGKAPLESYQKAQAILRRHTVKDRPHRSAYHCGHCGAWHIGTDNGAVEKRKASEFKQRKFHE